MVTESFQGINSGQTQHSALGCPSPNDSFATAEGPPSLGSWAATPPASSPRSPLLLRLPAPSASSFSQTLGSSNLSRCSGSCLRPGRPRLLCPHHAGRVPQLAHLDAPLSSPSTLTHRLLWEITWGRGANLLCSEAPSLSQNFHYLLMSSLPRGTLSLCLPFLILPSLPSW